MVREYGYKPAGMTDSDSYPLDAPVPNLAMGYMADPASPLKWRENTFEHVLRGGPAGGGYSTVRDLNRFAAALRADALLKPETRATMWTEQFAGSGYDDGSRWHDTPLGRATGHSGGLPGLSSVLTMYDGSGYVVAVMSNNSYGASVIERYIGALLTCVR